jgi:hypothetical protein
MTRQQILPCIFLGISLGAIALEACLSRLALVRARYRVEDTWASLGMTVGNYLMNLMMAGLVFAGGASPPSAYAPVRSRRDAWTGIRVGGISGC